MAGPQFTEEQIRRSLLTLAKHAGNSVRAAADLAEQGITITDGCLRQWRLTTHADLYRQLHETYATEIEAPIIAEYRELAQAATETARLAVDKTRTQLENNEHKNPSGAARDLATTGAIAMDKLYLATDRPTHITEHRNADEILRGIEGRWVNGTAIEEPPTPPLLTQSDETNARDLAEAQ